MKKSLTTPLLFGLALTLASLTNPPAKDATYQVDATQSKLAWTARKVTGQHNGLVPVRSGSLVLSGQKLKGGSFEADLSALTVLDLTDATSNAKLLGHLKSDDFFSTEKHPTARFVITSATPKGGTNYDLTGKLTIKGITNEVTFPATVKLDGDRLTASAKITVDRTKYDIKYRSKSFFENLGDKTIYDDFDLDVALVASAGGTAAAKSSR